MLWKASNLLQKFHTLCLKDLNITPAQFSLMTCLVYLHQGGPVTSTRIVEQTGMDKMMISDLIKTLLKKRMILKEMNPSDGRSFIVVPTQLGIKTTNQSVRRIETMDREFFSKLEDMQGFSHQLALLVRGNEWKDST